MLVFNYTLNICSAVGIRVAPIRTSFRTPPPLLPVTGFRFLVISSLVYILSRRLSRSMYSFFFSSFPRFPIHPLSAGRATPVSDYATKTCLPLARWIGTCRFSFLLFSFLLFRPGNGGHGGVLWIVNAHLFSLLWNGVDNDRETKGGEREREGKGWNTDIRRFVSVSFIGKVRWELCDDIPSSTNMPSWWAIFHHVTELINISNNIVLLNDRIRFSM